MGICASNLRDCQAELEKKKLTLGEKNDEFYLREAPSWWLVMWLWGSRGRPRTAKIKVRSEGMDSRRKESKVTSD